VVVAVTSRIRTGAPRRGTRRGDARAGTGEAEVGAAAGVAANMVGLAYIAAAQDRRAEAEATLDEAYAIAQSHGAYAIVRQIEQARTRI
jgi:hypothetical protein